MIQELPRSGLAGAGYAGPDRRLAEIAGRSIVRVHGPAVVGLLSLSVLGWYVGSSEVTLPDEPQALAVGFAAGSVAITVSAGLISLGRFVIQRHRGSLDVGLLMIVLGLGWLLPLRVSQSLGDSWSQTYGAAAIGAACAILGLIVSTAVSPLLKTRLSVPRHLLLAAAPLFLGPLLVVASGVEFDARLLQRVSVPLMAVAAVIALWAGFLQGNSLLGFVGIELIGIQLAEVFALNADATGSQSWLVGASVVAIAAALIGLYGVAVDIQESHVGSQKKLFETWTALQSSQRLATAERQQTQGRMHSLRSALLGVEAVALTIGQSDNPAETGEVLAMEAGRLRELTRRSKLEITTFDLTDALRPVVETQLRRGVALTVDVPGQLIVRAARPETVDAIHSLIDNAVRHAPGSPITVTARFRLEPEALLEIKVRDRGPGVPPKIREKIFRHGVTTHRDGTGLGLPVAKMVAEAQGGQLYCQPRLGGGAEFVLRLPLEPIGAQGIFA